MAEENPGWGYARNLTDYEEGFLNRKRFNITDSDGKFSPGFKSILDAYGIAILLTSHLAPNMNAYGERFLKSIKSECLDQMIFLGPEVYGTGDCGVHDALSG